MRVRLSVYEGERVVFDGFKYVRPGSTAQDYERLVEHEAALAYFYRRMRYDPLFTRPQIVEGEEKGEKVIRGIYSKRKDYRYIFYLFFI